MEMDPKTKELVALAASLAARCQPCFAYHLQLARELGVPARALALVGYEEEDDD